MKVLNLSSYLDRRELNGSIITQAEFNSREQRLTLDLDLCNHMQHDYKAGSPEMILLQIQLSTYAPPAEETCVVSMEVNGLDETIL